MRFHQMFSRYKGSVPTGAVALGADVDPQGVMTSDVRQALKGQDNVLHARFYDNRGWPNHRIGIGYKAPSGSLALVCTAYLYDQLSDFWYVVDAAGFSLVANKINYVDFISVPELPDNRNNEDKAVGTIADIYFRITDPGAAPNGEHVFVMAPDLTTPGL